MSDAAPAGADNGPDAIAQRLREVLRASATRRLAIDTGQAPLAWLHDRLLVLPEQR